MGWTRPIFGIRISPILTTGAGAVGLAGGTIGFVAWVAGAGGSVVVVVGGGTGRSAKDWSAVETGESAAPASAGAPGRDRPERSPGSGPWPGRARRGARGRCRGPAPRGAGRLTRTGFRPPGRQTCRRNGTAIGGNECTVQPDRGNGGGQYPAASSIGSG